MTTSLLAASLIVRNEARLLPECLETLAPVVDEVHVYDTGSTDETPQYATASGPWREDFAAARNAATADWTATWVLAADADHRVTADVFKLRKFLAETPAETLMVQVDDEHHSGHYRQLETRLYRPDVVHWTGRVHERLVRADGGSPATATIPAKLLRLRHLGYSTHADLIRRAERNLALGRVALADLDLADHQHIAWTMLDIGRDCVAAEQWQQAVDTFESLRDLFPGTPEWLQATDSLARVMLASGHDEICLTLVDQLRHAGARTMYCDWLAAQALAQLGEARRAADLLAGVTEVIDTAGRRRSPAALKELSALVERLRVLT